MQRGFVSIVAVAGLALAAQADVQSPSLALNAAEAMASGGLAQAAAPAKAKSTDWGNFWSGWKHTIEVGLNGSQGNTDSINARGAFGAVREAEDMTTAAGISYLVGREDSQTTKSRGEVFIRNDWVLSKPWGFFATAKAEYDEFQPWQWRLSAALGPSYLVVDTERTMFKLRAGVGASYRTGKQAEEKLIPELDLGFDLTHKFTERTKGFVTFDLYPSLDRFGSDYRHVTSAGLEVIVDPEINMLLKLGAQNRYDSTTKAPGRKNDLDYFLTLAWTF